MKALMMMALAACFFSVSANASTCREGQEEMWETNNGGEYSAREVFICKNGRFIKKFGHVEERAPRYLACREGSLERFSRNNGGESDIWETYVCRSGKFVPLYNNEPVRNDAPRWTCKEGSREIFLENDSGSDVTTPVHYVCRHGRFVRQ